MSIQDYRKQLEELLLLGVQKGASDIHVSPGYYPTLRIEGALYPLNEQGVVSQQDTAGMTLEILSPEQSKRFDERRDIDFTFVLNDNLRFRVNCYHARGGVAMVLHVVPDQIRSLTELNLPDTVSLFSKLSQGLVLVTGPTGSGKSTTMASIIQLINQERSEKIVTIEDPIEYVYGAEKSIIDQRELLSDALTYNDAIRAALRENINVLMIGEMRDMETIEAALTAAETGHLVFSSMHTQGAAQTVERIVNSVSADRQSQVIIQLADVLAGIVSQRLVPAIQGGRVPAVELLVANAAIRNTVRMNRPDQIPLAIDTGAEDGMISMNRSLSMLVKGGLIAAEQARFYSPNVKELDGLIKK